LILQGPDSKQKNYIEKGARIETIPKIPSFGNIFACH